MPSAAGEEPAKYTGGIGSGWRPSAPPLHVDVLAVEVDHLAGPQAPDHVEELAAADVAIVLAQPVAVGVLLGRVAAGDDVEQQAAAAVELVRRRHLGRQGG